MKFNTQAVEVVGNIREELDVIGLFIDEAYAGQGFLGQNSIDIDPVNGWVKKSGQDTQYPGLLNIATKARQKHIREAMLEIIAKIPPDLYNSPGLGIYARKPVPTTDYIPFSVWHADIALKEDEATTKTAAECVKRCLAVSIIPTPLMTHEIEIDLTPVFGPQTKALHRSSDLFINLVHEATALYVAAHPNSVKCFEVGDMVYMPGPAIYTIPEGADTNFDRVLWAAYTFSN